MDSKFIEIDSLKKAIHGLAAAFPWHRSTEDLNYWKTVSDRLETYLRQAELARGCQEEINELKRRIAELEARC